MSNYTQWINKAPLTFTIWGENEPAEFATEDCAVGIRKSWADLPCNDLIKSRIICEYNSTLMALT
jgi:hypothetical protein